MQDSPRPTSPITTYLPIFAMSGGERLPGGHRQHHSKARADAGARVDLDASAVRLDDAVADRKAQARSLAGLLGGEEWIKDLRQHLLRYAFAVIADLDGNVPGIAHAGAHDDAATGFGRRLRGVDDQVQHHLVDLRGRAGDGGHLA